MNFLNNIKVRYRFLLAGSMSLVLAALPTFFFLRGELMDLGVARTERLGVAPVRDLLDVNRLLQQHRGLSNRLLSGDAQAAAKLKDVERALEQKQVAVKTYVEDQTPPDTIAQWQQTTAQWTALRDKLNAGGMAAADSFEQHTSLIRRLNDSLGLLLDDSGLALDPVSDTYHLIVASAEVFYLTEAQAKLRGLASGMLAAKSITSNDLVQIRMLLAQVRDEHERVAGMFAKAYRGNSALEARIKESLQAASESSDKAEKLTQDELLRSGDLTYAADAYFGALTVAIDRQYEVADKALALVDEMLQARFNEAQYRLLLVLAAMALTMAVGTTMSLLGGRSVTRQLGGEPDDVTRWVGTIAQGDLTSSLPMRDAVAGSIVHAMAGMQASLQKMVQQVRSSADQVVDASSQIAAGNTDLSGRTERQASALEEISSSMEELLATVRQNADNARQANGLASSASDVASRGGAQMAEVVDTMKGISSSAHKIGDIIGVIDGIAFQTNILALNAAVEAARAGEQGRGFAVVATEVRNLAQRSAVAAKEIKDLISDSISKVEQGGVLVGQTGDTMHEMVASVRRVTDIMGEVAASSIEQTSGIEQVSSAIVQMDQVTQQNAALVEQAAASAAALRDQSTHLREFVSSFKVAHGQEPVAASAPVSYRPPAAPSRKPVTAAPKPASVPKLMPKSAAKPAAAASKSPASPARQAEPVLKRPALGQTPAAEAGRAHAGDVGTKAPPALSDNDWEEF